MERISHLPSIWMARLDWIPARLDWISSGPDWFGGLPWTGSVVWPEIPGAESRYEGFP